MTVFEWIQGQGVSSSDIDFIETVLVNQSVYEHGGINDTQLTDIILRNFPQKICHLRQPMTLSGFEKPLDYNNISINGQETVRYCLDQGLCTALCNRMLND